MKLMSNERRKITKDSAFNEINFDKLSKKDLVKILTNICALSEQVKDYSSDLYDYTNESTDIDRYTKIISGTVWWSSVINEIMVKEIIIYDNIDKRNILDLFVDQVMENGIDAYKNVFIKYFRDKLTL
jgi:hypothetical protein